MSNVKRVRYSEKVDAKLLATTPILNKGVFNTSYQGSPVAGAVKIPTTTDVVAGAYDPSTGMSATTGTLGYETLLTDKQLAFNERVDGYDAEAFIGNQTLLGERLASGSHAMSIQIETALVNVLETQGTSETNTTALTKDTVFDVIIDSCVELTKANVPENGRWILVSPATQALLIKSNQFIKASDVGQNMLITGAVGQINGVNIFVSNLLGATTEYIIGHSQNAHLAMEWQVEPRVKDAEVNFIGAAVVQGRKVYGAMVSNAKTIRVKKTATKATK